MTWPFTPWHSASTKPMRDGLYMTSINRANLDPDDNECGRVMWWRNGKWVDAMGVATVQTRWWRGLAFDPSKAEPRSWSVPFRAGYRLESGWWVPKP